VGQDISFSFPTAICVDIEPVFISGFTAGCHLPLRDQAGADHYRGGIHAGAGDGPADRLEDVPRAGAVQRLAGGHDGGRTVPPPGLKTTLLGEGGGMYGLQGAHDERPVSRHSVLHWTLSSQTRMVSQDVILHILDGMACGMAHIHDKNIIHGDLK